MDGFLDDKLREERVHKGILRLEFTGEEGQRGKREGSCLVHLHQSRYRDSSLNARQILVLQAFLEMPIQ